MPIQTFKVRVNKNLLKWAREQRKFTPEWISKRLEMQPDEYSKLESSGIIPSWSVFEELANELKYSTAVFFMSKPPEKRVITDFRLSGDLEAEWSFEFTKVLDQVEEISKETKNIHQLLKMPVLPSFASVPISSNPEMAGIKFRKLIRVSFERQLDSKTELFTVLRNAIEKLNIYILKLPFPRSDARGFSRLQRGEPAVIVINSNNGTYERNFTLLHEVGHILLKISGVCIPRLNIKSSGPKWGVERWCNRFAASVLLPKEDILREGILIRSIKKGDVDFIFTARRNYKASGEALIFRMVELGEIGFEQANEIVRRYQQKYKDKLLLKPERVGGDYYLKIVAQLGRKLISTISIAHNSGKISVLHASDALGMKIDNFPKLQKFLSR